MSVLVIEPSGTIRFLYTDDLRALVAEGAAEIRRVSHVEPTAAGQWTADMAPVAGPVLGPYDTRAEALAAEIRWLDINFL